MASRKRILLVDDDGELRQSLVELLDHDGEYETVAVGSGSEALDAVRGGTFDLVLLDVGLPDGDGRAVCRTMRANGFKAPIVMLTGVDTDTDTVEGLNAGANDYVVKPFRLNVLLARLRAQLRTYEQNDDAVFSIGPYKFQPALKQLLDSGSNRRIRLTEKETAILKYLYRSGDKVIGRDQLLNEVWGYNAGVTTHTLETHVYRLRQKIEPDPGNACILVTEPGGYRLVP